MSSSDLESQVRRALGAPSPKSAHKRRFGIRTDVEVVVLPGRSQSIRDEDRVELREALKARNKFEQDLTAAHATIRNLQTKVAHLEMCAEELREQHRRASGRIEVLEADLAHQIAAANQAKARLEAEIAAKKATQKNPIAPKRADPPSIVFAPEKSHRASVQSKFLLTVPSENTSAGRGKNSYRTEQKPVDWWSHHEGKVGRR